VGSPPCGAEFLFRLRTHGLRRGLQSFAALRLGLASSPASFYLDLVHEFLEVLPLDQDDVVILKNLFEFRAGDEVVVALAPD
jgi:hypothetical protein